MKLHDLLNFFQPFESHYKACNFLNDKLSQVMLHCALITYILFGNFLDFWKCKSTIYAKIFYKNYVNKNP